MGTDMLLHTSWHRFRFFRSWVGFEHAYYHVKANNK